jgi:hypothetical protein
MPLNHPDDVEATPDVDGTEILAAVDDAFRDCPGLEELGLLFSDGPVSQEEAQEAVGGGSGKLELRIAAGAVVVVDQKLALAYWCLPALLTAAKEGIERFRQIPDWWSDGEHAEAMHKCTRAMLLIAADTSSAWNHRKRLIQAGVLSRVSELRFLNLVQSKHQKCQEAWAHRRWVVLPLLLAESGEPPPPDFVDTELAATERCVSALSLTFGSCAGSSADDIRYSVRRAVSLYRKNYNAWSYKLWLCKRLPADRHLYQPGSAPSPTHRHHAPLTRSAARQVVLCG